MTEHRLRGQMLCRIANYSLNDALVAGIALGVVAMARFTQYHIKVSISAGGPVERGDYTLEVDSCGLVTPDVNPDYHNVLNHLRARIENEI